MQLFARHSRELRAYSRLILHSVDSIDDVMEEICVAILEKQAQLHHEDEFLPWEKPSYATSAFATGGRRPAIATFSRTIW